MPLNLRKLAAGQPCYLRLQGCTHDREQTVLCHIRRGNIAGVGQKPCDAAAFPACEHCHGVFDGRYRSSYTRVILDAEALRALCQWLSYCWQREYIIPGGLEAA